MALKKSYSQLKQELQIVMDQLQDEETDIDAALELYKKASTLLAEMESYLQKSKHTLQRLKPSE